MKRSTPSDFAEQERKKLQRRNENLDLWKDNLCKSCANGVLENYQKYTKHSPINFLSKEGKPLKFKLFCKETTRGERRQFSLEIRYPWGESIGFVNYKSLIENARICEGDEDYCDGEYFRQIARYVLDHFHEWAVSKSLEILKQTDNEIHIKLPTENPMDVFRSNNPEETILISSDSEKSEEEDSEYVSESEKSGKSEAESESSGNSSADDYFSEEDE